ncbi:hypothetical protein AVL50_12890 [Flammeovirga sp. SJP92]|nr:hypothetical protein AVL50_12890 [Flammeovirga sp. SJP92]
MQTEKFTSELLELKEYFNIPGLAVSIEKEGETVYREYFGESDVENGTKLDSNTLFPIASITKVFSGVLLMRLVEKGKLSLSDPINRYVLQPAIPDEILIHHVLSHTSQGNVGLHFYYSSRFSILTQVIEKASGQTFAEIVQNEIFIPLKLKNTFLLKDSTQIIGIAKPYILEDGVEDGFIDYGYSASAGIVSNLEDLAIFNKAMDRDLIINKQSKETMFSSFREGLPYGYGIFNQQFENLNLVWAYGQYDCYSSLLLKVPSEDITLILLANNSLLSDPARLIYGDVTSSLFALSFLKNFLLDLPQMPLLESPETITQDLDHQEIQRKKILAQALSESYMARYDTEKLESSAKLLEFVFTNYLDYLNYADLNLLHNLSFLKDVAFYKELGDFKRFDQQIETIGEQLSQQEPNNPYVHIYMGTYYDRKGNKEKARHHFESIVKAKNFSQNWYSWEAKKWLEENH